MTTNVTPTSCPTQLFQYSRRDKIQPASKKQLLTNLRCSYVMFCTDLYVCIISTLTLRFLTLKNPQYSSSCSSSALSVSSVNAISLNSEHTFFSKFQNTQKIFFPLHRQWGVGWQLLGTESSVESLQFKRSFFFDGIYLGIVDR